MIAEGYGIFKDETALQYIKRWNPSVGHNKKGSRTFSYSSYNTYFECPLRWFWKYADKKKPKEVPDTRNTLEGGALHNLLEAYIKDKGYANHTAWLKQNTRPFFENYIKDMERCDWKSKNDKDKAYEKYLKLVARGVLYLNERVIGNQKYILVEPERKFVVNVAPGLTINGFIDLAMVTQYGGVEVVDYKGGNPYYVSKEQLLFYGIAGMALYEGPIDSVSFVYPGANQEKVYRFQDSDYEQLIYKLQVVGTKIKENKRVPAANSSACKWCIFKNECEEKPL
jgi:hypothetical protein